MPASIKALCTALERPRGSRLPSKALLWVTSLVFLDNKLIVAKDEQGRSESIYEEDFWAFKGKKFIKYWITLLLF